jgi:hypothetical protein
MDAARCIFEKAGRDAFGGSRQNEFPHNQRLSPSSYFEDMALVGGGDQGIAIRKPLCGSLEG